MTVGELIERLKGYDPSTRVALEVLSKYNDIHDGMFGQLRNVVISDVEPDLVVLEATE